MKLYRWIWDFAPTRLVEDKVVVELKSVEQIAPVHKKQLNTSLKVTNLKLGLLMNFGGVLLRNNVIRVVNGLQDEPYSFLAP